MPPDPDRLIRKRIADLEATAADRPVGYVAVVLSAAERYDGRHYWIRRGVFDELVERFSAFGPPTAAPGGCGGCGG